MQNWYAPSLTSNKEAGLGDWSIEEIVDLLRTGVSHRGAVYGPMAEVTFDSLQYLNDADVRAMAVYLKSLGQGSPPAQQTSAVPAPESSLLMAFGQTVYATHCAVCHGADGRGMPPDYPPLAGNPSIQMASAVNPIRMVLNGGFPPGTRRKPDALRHAAVRAEPVRRRGRRRGHLYPRRLGQPGRGGFRASGQRTAHGAGGLMRPC